MDSELVPDDIWIDIFENLSDPVQLANLIRTCHRFRVLATRPLLRNLKWVKAESSHRNLEAWGGVYQDCVSLPRKLTVGVTLELTAAMKARWPSLSPEMILHDLIYAQMPLFTSLRELDLNGTVISPYTYQVLATIPTLRSLQIKSCSYIPLKTSFRVRIEQQGAHLGVDFPLLSTQGQVPNTAPPFPYDQSPTASAPVSHLPITHFSIHNGVIPSENDAHNNTIQASSYHPLHLITSPALASLCITWTTSLAATYASKKWLLPSVVDLDVLMPHLTRDLLDALVGFVGNCPLVPRIRMKIERHNLSEQQIGAIQVPTMRGVWDFEGPLMVAAGLIPTTQRRFASSMHVSGQSANQIHTRSQNGVPSLVRIVMSEPLDLHPLLDGLEKLPDSLEELEVQMRLWDMEVLFAVRQLFPTIRKVVVRYAYRVLPDDFFVTLGSGILFDLKNLHTIRIICDRSCGVTNRHLVPVPGQGVPAGAAAATGGFAGIGTVGGGGGPFVGFATGGQLNINGNFVQHADQQLQHQAQNQAQQQYLQQQYLQFQQQQQAHQQQQAQHNYQSFFDTMGGPMDVIDAIDGVEEGDDNYPLSSNHAAAPSSGSTSGFAFVSVQSSSGPSAASTSNLATISSSAHMQMHQTRWNRGQAPIITPSINSSLSNTNANATLNHSLVQTPTQARNLSQTRVQTESSSHRSQHHVDLRDYLVGWNRYCPSLRCVQVDESWCWERRFVGDQWAERLC